MDALISQIYTAYVWSKTTIHYPIPPYLISKTSPDLSVFLGFLSNLCFLSNFLTVFSIAISFSSPFVFSQAFVYWYSCNHGESLKLALTLFFLFQSESLDIDNLFVNFFVRFYQI